MSRASALHAGMIAAHVVELSSYPSPEGKSLTLPQLKEMILKSLDNYLKSCSASPDKYKPSCLYRLFHNTALTRSKFEDVLNLKNKIFESLSVNDIVQALKTSYGTNEKAIIKNGRFWHAQYDIGSYGSLIITAYQNCREFGAQESQFFEQKIRLLDTLLVFDNASYHR